MSRIKYIHVIEQSDGDRLIRPGKGDPSGTFVSISDDGEDWERLAWERVDYWRLPEPMAKSEFQDWWNEHKDAGVDPIPDVLEAMEVPA